MDDGRSTSTQLEASLATSFDGFAFVFNWKQQGGGDDRARAGRAPGQLRHVGQPIGRRKYLGLWSRSRYGHMPFGAKTNLSREDKKQINRTNLAKNEGNKTRKQTKPKLTTVDVTRAVLGFLVGCFSFQQTTAILFPESSRWSQRSSDFFKDWLTYRLTSLLTLLMERNSGSREERRWPRPCRFGGRVRRWRFAPCGPGTTAAPAATLLRCRPFHGERIHWMYHFYADTLGNEILLDPFTLSWADITCS